MVWTDPIVEKIHRIREDIMKEHDNDLHKLFEHLRKRQKTEGRKIVTRSPHRPASQANTNASDLIAKRTMTRVNLTHTGGFYGTV